MYKTWLATLLFMLLTCAPAGADSLLLQNAKVVDPKTKTITTGDILILDGRIANAEKKNGETYRTINLTGKWIIAT